MPKVAQSLALAGITFLSLNLASALASPDPAMSESSLRVSSAPTVDWQMTSSTPSGTTPQCASGKKEKGEKHFRHKGHDRCGVFNQLGLTDDQKAQLKAKREAFKARMQASGKNWHDLTREERMANREVMKRDLAMVLTPSQYAQFQTLMQQCREKHRPQTNGQPPVNN